MASREQLEAELASPHAVTATALATMALAALDHDLCEAVAVRLERELAAGLADDRRLWQALGLARRGLQDSAAAHAAFLRAAALAPRDPLIAHSVARTALEAGFPAAALFERAGALAPADAAIILGRAAARMAEGEGGQARADLADVLSANPGWLEGHATFAKITASSTPDEDPGKSLRAALARFPRDASLWFALIRTAIERQDYAGALGLVEKARSALGAVPELTRIEAVCHGELGDPAHALAIFARLLAPDSASITLGPLRNLIRLERFDQALLLAEQAFDAQQDRTLWPYRALLWRVMGDPRWDWLEGDPRMVGIYDLSGVLGNMADLVARLRALHCGVGQPLDQSVRRGSQTDGNLLARAEPELRALRAAVLDAVGHYVAQLPPAVGGHPTLIARRSPLRVAGAWSVRLTDHGFHVDHMHLQGWISSCLYLALPQDIGAGDGHDGWLTLGECRALLPRLDGFRVIEPKLGRLVLFPSLTWHGTRPFARGERLTVAFDIARPPA